MRNPLRALAVIVFCFVSLAARAQDSAASPEGELTITPSGLQYMMLKQGDGDVHPILTDQVTIHFTGWLKDGSVFDSSEEKKTPKTFLVSQMNSGWVEGLLMMTTGSRYRFIIPFDLAYGSRGMPPAIPPYAELTLEVELLKIEKAPELPRFTPPKPKNQTRLANGLKYEVITPGSGPQPIHGQRVEVEFAFWNEKGQLVDCSLMKGSNFKFKLGDQPLKFLNEGVELLKVGARYRFEVPAHLAYGARGAPPLVEGNESTLWEISLVKIMVPKALPKFSLPDGESMQSTFSGLQYQVIKEGTGVAPKIGQKVTVHYAGWLEDGTNFDESYSRGEPSRFRLGKVIQGWNEGLTLMRPGAIYRFLIPAELGYGAQGFPPTVPPGANLVFLVELIEVSD